MTQFNEKFPELKNYTKNIELLNALEFEINHHDGPITDPNGMDFVRKVDVKKHCLSKQRVLEAGKNMECYCDAQEEEERPCKFCVCWNNIKEELGI